MKTIVAALGGNALLRRREKLSLATQLRNANAAAKRIAPLARRHQLVITHGNGPQVGNILLQSELAAKKAYPVSLAVTVAESEGEIGFILEQALHNALKSIGIARPVASVLTRVLVRADDPAFQKPTKPVGPYYSAKEAKSLRKKGYSMAKINGSYRRVVPSPAPLKIIEADAIKQLARHTIVIAAGGGGIPVCEKGKHLQSVDAVIDKDLASARLAIDIKADTLLLLTDVPFAYLNYRKKSQKPIRRMSAGGAYMFLKLGHFAEGSMKPKVESAITFLRHGGKNAVITSPEKLKAALKGKSGTHITLN